MTTSTATKTHAQVATWTHTATHLADAIMGSLSTILGTLQLDLTKLTDSWALYQNGISVWLAEESLEAVVLECTGPDKVLRAAFEFPAKYSTDVAADAKFVHDHATLAGYAAKLKRLPAGCSYRILVTYRRTPKELPGWSSTSRLASDGMRVRVFGTVAAAPHASANLRYLYRP